MASICKTVKRLFPKDPVRPPILPSPRPPDVVDPVLPNNRLKFVTERSTGKFEGEGLKQVTGNSDKQGISLGILQWNYGQTSLQNVILKPYIALYGSIDALNIFPSGVDVTADMSASVAVNYCKLHMLDGTKVKKEWHVAWRQFLSLPEVVKLQQDACQSVSDSADRLSASYGFSSLKAYAFFFDVIVQNGSMKRLTREDALNLINNGKIGDVWAFMAKKHYYLVKEYIGQNDCEGNLRKWRDEFHHYDQETQILLALGYLRSRKSVSKYQKDVLNRKCTIAVGAGFVHNTHFDFSEAFNADK